MISNTPTPEMQRRFLLLARYLQALETGELEIASTILQAAEVDEVLERMVSEANASYQVTLSGEYSLAQQDEEDHLLVTSSLARLEAERLPENVQPGSEVSLTPRSISRTSHRQRGRLISGLAAVLLGVLLVSGFLVFMNASHRSLPPSPGEAGAVPMKSLIVVNGWRLEQIARSMTKLGLSHFHAQEFLNYTHHPNLFPDVAKYPILQHAPNMEGLLYPDTYQIPINANTVQVIDLMLTTFTQVVQQHNLTVLAQQHKLTEYQMVILASIVQREANSTRAMPLVAGIYWNRIEKPSPETGSYLASDATVEYARDTDHPPVQGQYWEDLSKTEPGNLTSPTSSWNTYTHPGWPPTPISSPGLAALQAAASPTATSCYYFLFKPADGSIVCAQTLAQFQQLANT